MRLALGYNFTGICKLCDGASESFDVVDETKFCSELVPYFFGLSGIPVYYHRCIRCGFIFTRHFDNWSKEEFSRRIYNDDYIKVDGEYNNIRPKAMAQSFARAFPATKNMRVLDYGSGTGEFASLLRSLGFEHVESYDPFSHPRRPDGTFDIITSIEVLEHSPAPLNTMEEILSFANDDSIIVLTTALQPDNISQSRGSWWYIGPRNGHVSIHSHRSLVALAKKFGLAVSPGINDEFHVMMRGQAVGSAGFNCDERPSFDDVCLYAPDEPNPDWHSAEGDTYRFRWSAKQEMSWQIAGEPLVLRLSVPFIMEIQSGYAEASKILVDGREVAKTISIQDHGRAISAVSAGTAPIREVRLSCPAPQRSATDARLLGIAVLARA